MEAENNNWGTLLDKYVRNEITPGEREEMERQMKSSLLKQRQFRERTDPEEFMKQLRIIHSFDRKKSWNKLKAELPFLQKTPVVPMHKRRAFKKWAYGLTGAAAALVLGVGLWAVLSSSKLPIKSYTYVKVAGRSERNLATLPRGVLYAVKNCKIEYNSEGEIALINDPSSGQPIEETFAVVTAPENRITIRLPDGSKVLLNAQSTIKVPISFNNNSRKVELTGEGFFEVTTMPHVPFIVSCKNDIAIQAVGTEFNVKNYENQEVVTTLIKGKVVMAIGKDSIRIREGEQVTTINKTAFKAPIPADKEKVTAWTSNDFYFKNRDLKELMQEVGRWYGYDVEFTSQNAIKIELTGKLNRNTNLDQLIKILEKGAQINIKKEGKKLIISPKK
jgi:ferric-dicitrate binding protein FerR (iron transport regulator)